MRNKSALKGIVLLLVLTTVFFVGCGDPVENFKSQVRASEYSKAIETYSENIRGNSAEENKCINFLEDYLNEYWTGYVEGKYSEENFENRYNTLKKINDQLGLIPELSDDYFEFTFNEVKSSKESFDRGVEFMEEGDYLSAMNAFSWVSYNDTENYDQAQEKYMEAQEAYEDAAIADAQALLDDGSYEQAVTTIEAAANNIGYTNDFSSFVQQAREVYEDAVLADAQALLDNGSYDQAVAAIEAAVSNIGYTDDFTDFVNQVRIDQYTSEMKTAQENGDHVQVITLYGDFKTKETIQPTAEMTGIYAASSTAFTDSVKSAAATAFGGDTVKDYEAAIQVLQEEIAKVPEDDDIVNGLSLLIEQYREYTPVPLTDLKYTSVSNLTDIYIGGQSWLSPYGDKEECLVDVNGTVYDSGKTIFVRDEGYVEYNLNFQYSTFSGIVYRPYGSLSVTEAWSGITKVQIYGDGALLWEAPDYSSDVYESTPFSVNVSGVRTLRLELDGAWGDEYNSHYNVSLIGIGEPMLQK